MVKKQKLQDTFHLQEHSLPHQLGLIHFHLDIVELLPSEGFRYILICVNRFTRWPEALSVENIEPETIGRAFINVWIARFCVPLTIATDQGCQF